jgi:hypothetical protein
MSQLLKKKQKPENTKIGQLIFSKITKIGLQEVVQLVGTTSNEMRATSSNPLPPSCVYMSKKKRLQR